MREINPNGKYQGVFGAYAEPLAYVDPGEEIVLYTEDAYVGRITREDQNPSESKGDCNNPQTGPIYVNGAEPGDTLAVHILDIEMVRPWAVSALVKNFGGVVANATTRLLNEPLPEKVWIYEYKDGMFRNGKHLYHAWEPFMGTMATAPGEGEAISSLKPTRQGGNMDTPEVCPGNIVYLPVMVAGAYFSTGDCHAKQGHGEVAGAALEISCKIRLKFELIKGKTIQWPRIESPEEIMCVGCAKPMEDAARVAYVELVEWMVELGWDRIEALQCLSQEVEIHVGSMVNPDYVMVAKVKKEVAYRCKE
ncbi:MAG: acetamidase [Ruminococcaceae bacterium]|nr:acetamidase [Oscillospiraceae bacterium]